MSNEIEIVKEGYVVRIGHRYAKYSWGTNIDMQDKLTSYDLMDKNSAMRLAKELNGVVFQASFAIREVKADIAKEITGLIPFMKRA